MKNTKKETILEEALRVTSGDRQNDYGPPNQDFARTAAMWEQLLQSCIEDGHLAIRPQDVASCMIALKLSRQTHQDKRDNWVDIAGYAHCGNICQEADELQEADLKDLEKAYRAAIKPLAVGLGDIEDHVETLVSNELANRKTTHPLHDK